MRKVLFVLILALLMGCATYPPTTIHERTISNPTVGWNGYSIRMPDGVVLIDQNVCIGCRNCTQSCPYGAPQFNSTSEKVEKCTFCLHRLRDGNGNRRDGFLPACVTTCVGNALQFVEDFNPKDSGRNAPEGFADPPATVPSVKFETG